MPYWSSRLLADHLGGISNVWVARAGVTGACSRGGGRRSSSPPTLSLRPKSATSWGLYLNPPEKVVVLSIDETSQIQAFDRTAPILAMRPGLTGESDA